MSMHDVAEPRLINSGKEGAQNRPLGDPAIKRGSPIITGKDLPDRVKVNQSRATSLTPTTIFSFESEELFYLLKLFMTLFCYFEICL